MPDTYKTVKELVKDLINYKRDNPTKKIAFVFSGGGARAAWFGGVIEAIETEVQKQQSKLNTVGWAPPDKRFAPDILVATSGGGLAAVGYFADLINSEVNKGDYGPYRTRQSWLWRDLSKGNQAAYSLLQNAGVLELVSGSKSGGTASIWPLDPHAAYNQIPVVGAIANMASDMSPKYNFEALFKSRADLWAAWNELKTSWNKFYGSFTALSWPSVVTKIDATTTNLKDVWTADVNAIQANISILETDVANIKSYLRHKNAVGLPAPKVTDALSVGLLTDGAAVVIAVVNAINHLQNELANLTVGTAKTLLGDIKTAIGNLQNLLTALKNEIEALNQRIFAIVTHLDDFIKFAMATALMVKTHSSVMNTPGLENTLHEVLRQATPETTAPNAKASAMDKAIFDHWKARRADKASDYRVRAPELILTASNISAGRLGLLCLCDVDTQKKLAKSHTWVIALDDANVAFGRSSQTARSSDPMRWIFGAWPSDYVEPLIVSKDATVGKIVAQPDKSGPSIPVIRSTSAPPPPPPPRPPAPAPNRGSVHPFDMVGSPFEENGVGVSQIVGNSLIAGAALTTAAIPLAFPPKLWRFHNPFGTGTFHHWFVDGGICDNRPIQQAINAGADCIVSFELTPLSAAIQDIPASQARPDIAAIAGDVLIDTPISSAFYRFLETYVGDNPTTTKKMWRIAPGDTAKNAKSIGVYDFNGYWESGQVRTGLFDWFMRGYLDAHGNIPANNVYNKSDDDACVAYKRVAASYGQTLNAHAMKSSPGFFVVDFANNIPFPGYQ